MILPINRFLIFLGIFLIFLGLIFSLFSKIPYFGKLPGDFYIKKQNFQFYFPFTSLLLVSLILSLIFYLILK